MRLRVSIATLLVLTACLRYEEAVLPVGRDAVLTVPLSADGAETDDPEALADALSAGVAAALPDGFGPEDRDLFIDRSGTRLWSPRSLAGTLDFSGVALGGGPAATLVTDRHVVYAAHVPLGEGSTVRFVARDGTRVERRLIEVISIPILEPEGTPIDLAVGRLDLPVPEGVAVYPLPAAPPGAIAALAGEDVPVVVTYSGRKATVATLWRTTHDGVRVVYTLGSRRLGVPEAAGHGAEWGDSSHPSFYVVGDTLVLASHYHTSQNAGAGPSYADPRVRLAVTAAVEALGG